MKMKPILEQWQRFTEALDCQQSLDQARSALLADGGEDAIAEVEAIAQNILDASGGASLNRWAQAAAGLSDASNVYLHHLVICQLQP